MAYNLAVTPGTLTPGLYLLVNLLAGQPSDGSGVLRVLLLAPKSAAGDLVANSEVRQGTGEDAAGVAFGAGSVGHLAAKALYAKCPAAIVDFAAPTAGTGAATLTLTLAGTPTADRVVRCKVAGREWDLAWLAGESPDVMKAKVVSSITSRIGLLPVTASSGGTGIVTITALNLGNVGNDIRARFYLTTAASATETVTPNVLTNLAGGSSDPDVTTILGVAQGKEYHVILPCLSNADAVSVAGTSNVKRINDFIALHNSGLDAKLQTCIYGTTTTLAAALTAAQSRNVGHCSQVTGVQFQSLPCELAADEAGDRVFYGGVDPAANRIGNPVGAGLYGAEDIVANNPTSAEKESAIGTGVSLLVYNALGGIFRLRPITTYCLNTSGAPDRRLLDTQNVDGAFAVARDLRTQLPAEFPNAKVAKDTVPGGDLPPEGVVEERDIRAFVLRRMSYWIQRGVVNRAKFEAAVLNGEFVVQVNNSDATQVDILVPTDIYQPLAKMGVVVNRKPA